MAYTKTPLNSTDQTTQIPLVMDMGSRDNTVSKDSVLNNCVIEFIQGESSTEPKYRVIKRDGTSVMPLSPFNPTTIGTIWGVYYSEALDLFLLASSTGLFQINQTTGQADGYIGSPAYSAPVGFTDYQYENGASIVVITDGNNIGSVTTGAFPYTAFTDPDIPKPHVPTPVYLDGYLFLATANGRIYNSDLNDPTSWSASNVIDVESYVDGAQAIARSGQYIVAFGTTSIQFFYDAANPTGTPLGVQSTVLQTGYLGGLVNYGEEIYFLGKSRNTPPAIYRLTGLKVERIASYPATRKLNYDAPVINAINAIPPLYSSGSIIYSSGHALYTWSQFTTANGNAEVNAITYALDIDAGTVGTITYQGSTQFLIGGSTSGKLLRPGTFNRAKYTTYFYLQGASGNNALQYFNSEVYQDNGVNFTATFRTSNFNFGSLRRKFGTRLLLTCDQTPVTSLMSIRWTDDDFQTWNTPRTINLASVYPVLYSLGTFRKRAWELSYTDNYPMRISTMELDYSIGQA